jgi:hypothetical protein
LIGFGVYRKGMVKEGNMYKAWDLEGLMEQGQYKDQQEEFCEFIQQTFISMHFMV